MEFFSNIWNWIVGNKDAILAFLTSAEVVAIASAGVVFFKKLKKIKANTQSSADLSTALQDNKDLKNKIDVLAKENEELKAQNSKIIEVTELSLGKTTAIVECLSVVYNHSIKDAETRNTVNNLLTNARFAENKTRADLIKQLEDLKAQSQKQAEDMKHAVDEAENKLSNVVLRG